MNHCSILLVDDDEEWAEALIGALVPKNYQFDYIKTRSELYDRLSSPMRYHLILLDLELDKSPNEPIGLELIREIKEDYQVNTPIIVMTISDDENHIERSQKEGADAYIVKDIFSPSLFHFQFERTLKHRDLQQELSKIKSRSPNEYENEHQLIGNVEYIEPVVGF